VTEDFVTRLGTALRDAADREERRRAPSRAAAAARATLPRVQPRFALAGLAAAALLALVVALAATRSPEPAQPSVPKVVARLAPAPSVSQVRYGFGSAWVVDPDSQRLLRMDPSTREVTKAFAIPGIKELDVGRDAIWITEVTPSDLRLLRLDPKRNDLVGQTRIPGHPGGPHDGGFPVAVGDGVWVVDVEKAVRVDQATRRVTGSIRLKARGYNVRDATPFDGDLWVLRADGTLRRFDAATGAQKARFHAPIAGGMLGTSLGLFIGNHDHIARLDPKTGRVLWRATVPEIGAVAAQDGRLWLETPGRAGDRVVALDPHTGRTVASVEVGEFSATWMAPVRSELWLSAQNGHIAVITP
jgi:hypothetical protein